MSKQCGLFMTFILLCGLSLGSVAWAENSGTIKVRIINLQNKKGVVDVMLFKSEEDYPIVNGENTFKIIPASIASDYTAEVTFVDVPYGDYAVVALHDENNNQKMDFDDKYNPIEGIAASNNKSCTDFEEAKFTLDQSRMVVGIQMKYYYL
ncbi:MAG TPA: DUF2141 domain-containing protein [Bacillota bacterium]|nr:DUF2141 domain-containing protein [Bacillota bacterium]